MKQQAESKLECRATSSDKKELFFHFRQYVHLFICYHEGIMKIMLDFSFFFPSKHSLCNNNENNKNVWYICQLFEEKPIQEIHF